MSPTTRVTFAAAAVGLFCVICLLSACNQRPPQHAANTPATRRLLTRPFTPAFPAMTYYDQSCANCHGPAGAFYGPTLGNDLTDDGLIQKCHAMSVGPGNAPTSDDENLVLTAYHRSLIMRTPYVAVTEITGTHWTGEVTPGADVLLQLNGRSIAAKITDWNWVAVLPANIAPADVTIQAGLNTKTTSLKLSDGSYSSTIPLPPADQRHK